MQTPPTNQSKDMSCVAEGQMRQPTFGQCFEIICAKDHPHRRSVNRDGLRIVSYLTS
jgi:hypothetical protein